MVLPSTNAQISPSPQITGVAVDGEGGTFHPGQNIAARVGIYLSSSGSGWTSWTFWVGISYRTSDGALWDVCPPKQVTLSSGQGEANGVAFFNYAITDSSTAANGPLQVSAALWQDYNGGCSNAMFGFITSSGWITIGEYQTS
jgi:hypothetical protein